MSNPSQSNPKMRDFARLLLAREAGGGNATVRVTEKLRHPLSTLAGAAGFHSLLSRALTLARREVPGLGAAHIRPDGSLDGFTELPAEAGVTLVAQLLGLLETFIGEYLTLSVVRGAWPDLPSGDSNFGERNHHHEPAK